MADVSFSSLEPPHPCPYLEGRDAQNEIRLHVDASPAELETYLECGWRHFGPVFFRPACANCNECVSLRVVVDAFAPTKSQRRAARNAAHLTRSVSFPRVDEERLALYRAWHSERERTRGWEANDLDLERYEFDFAYPHPSVREVAFRDPSDGNRLVGLGIIDETPRALSAVFFFYDPERAPPSLGVAHVVMLLEQARRDGRSFVYLGYRVADCASLRYKARFGPHELLAGRPDALVDVRWRRPER